jgi:pimeloyl-ACP methyl ester carboxylesterase
MPRRIYTALELPRAMLEMSALLPARRWLLRTGQGGEGQPVMCLPGFSAGDGSTAILRRFLRRWGYDARPWGLGQNMNPGELASFEDVKRARDRLLSQLEVELEKIVAETGHKVSLIGWSLGGIMARWFACHHPHLVRQIITLGTPFGDPRAVIVYPLMERLRHKPMTEQDLDEWLAMCDAPLDPSIPLSIVYSRSDGFVSPHIATKQDTRTVENIHVPCSHVGFTVNPLSLYVIANRLAQPQHDWQPFARRGVKEVVFS